MREMTDKETASHIRSWITNKPVSIFSWPTDSCGYDQHIKFVEHRNSNWEHEAAKGKTFDQFCLEYADSLELLQQEEEKTS